MSNVAYCYYDPSWEAKPTPETWGWTFDAVYEDADPKRSQLRAFLKAAAVAPPDCLVVRTLADLGDSLAPVAAMLNTVEQLGICVIALDPPYRSDFSLATVGNPESGEKGDPHSLPLHRLQLLDALLQQQRSRQIRQGHAQNRLKGLPPPGRAPYGYRRGRDRYVIDRNAAVVLRDFYDHFLIYGSVRGAVRHTNQKHGKTISVSTGQRWLTHPVYRGHLEHGGAVQRDTHPPILPMTEAAQVDRLLRRNRSLAPRAASAPRSLSGLVICGDCQSSMSISRVTAPRQSEEYLYLRPKTCPRKPKCKALRYEAVLERTIAQICQTLPQAVAELGQPPLDRLSAELITAIAAKQQVIAQLPELAQQQILDQKTLDLRAYTLKTEIAELQDKLAQLPPVNLSETAKTVSIAQFWQDLSEQERRFYFREFIRSIAIERQGTDWTIRLHLIF